MTMTEKLDLSIVVPCLNEQECLKEFHSRMTAACKASEISLYEIIYVNDGSTDRTLQVLVDFCRSDSSTKVIDLARNFGHQIALSAGLLDTQGELVLTIDADLQDPPELLPAMIHKMAEGADVVYGKRNRRKGEGLFKRASAAIFYRVLSRISGISIALDVGDFRLMRRNVVDVLIRLPETHRFVRGLVSWVGFSQVPIHYDREPRHAGVTKYPFSKMLGLSLGNRIRFYPASRFICGIDPWHRFCVDRIGLDSLFALFSQLGSGLGQCHDRITPIRLSAAIRSRFDWRVCR